MAADSSTGAAAACVRDLAESAAAAGRAGGGGAMPLWYAALLGRPGARRSP